MDDKQDRELDERFNVLPLSLEDVKRDELPKHHHYIHPRQTSPSQITTANADRSTAFLDGLRGLAALCVFTQHFVGSFTGNEHEHGFGQYDINQDGSRKYYYYFVSFPLIRIFYNGGGAAVSIFFVLSGYVLSQSPVKVVRNSGGSRDGKRRLARQLLSAMVKRPFRLYLPCICATVIIGLMMHLPGNLYPDIPWNKAQPALSLELVNVFTKSVQFLNPFQSHGSNRAIFSYDLVLWTIPIELKGSFLIYALVAIYGLTTVPRSWYVSLSMLATFILLQLGFYSGACFIAGLALTIIDLNAIDLSYYAKKLTPRGYGLLMHLDFLVGSYLLSQVAVSNRPEWSSQTPGWHLLTRFTPGVYGRSQYYRFWQSYGAILFVYSTLRLQWLQRMFDSRPLRYLGRVSFMLYLFHLPFINIAGENLGRVFGHVGLGSEAKWFDNLLPIPDMGPLGLNTRFVFLWSVMLIACLGIAEIATEVIDTPSVQIGKMLSSKLGLDPTPKSERRLAVDIPRPLD